MTFEAREQRLLQNYRMLENDLDRFDWIIQKGLSLKDKNVTERIESKRIDSCDSGLWMTVSEQEGKIQVSISSDALLVQGVASLAAELVEGLTIDEALLVDENFPDKLYGDNIITPQRCASLKEILYRIRKYAEAWKKG